MRCKVGDWAMLVKSERGREGSLVEVVKFHGDYRYNTSNERNCWFVRGRVDPQHRREIQRDFGTAIDGLIPDTWMRPIRPGDIEDETPTEIVKELCNERQF